PGDAAGIVVGQASRPGRFRRDPRVPGGFHPTMVGVGVAEPLFVVRGRPRVTRSASRAILGMVPRVHDPPGWSCPRALARARTAPRSPPLLQEPPMNGFIFASGVDNPKHGPHDATGAFRPGAQAFKTVHNIPQDIYYFDWRDKDADLRRR